MKKLLAPLFLLPLLACHAAPETSAMKALDSNDLLEDSEISTDNTPGFCSIDWTAEKLADVSKAGDMDKPLLLNIADFQHHAKKQLSALFGDVGAGQLYYQDMFGRATLGDSSVNLDFARLFFTAPTPADVNLGSDIAIAYAASAAGELNIGFARIGKDYVDFVYPGLLVVYDNEKISKADFIARMNELKTTIAPDLVWNNGNEINPTLLLWAPVTLPENGNVEQTKQFIELWKALSQDEAVSSLELDGEAVSGTPTHGKKILIKDSEDVIDMNALRTVSKEEFASEVPFSTLPSLAKPFGIGCKVINPLLTEGNGEEISQPETPAPEEGDGFGINF